MRATKKLPWLRLHTEIIDDPKLSDFTGDEFRVWIYLLCCARESAVPGTIGMTTQGIAWRVRLPIEEVERGITKCEAREMLTRDHVTVSIRNWPARQFDKPSDAPEKTSTRKRVSREKETSHADVTPVSRAPSVQSQIQNREETENSSTASAVVANGATPTASNQPVLVSTPETWPPDLDAIRKHLDRLQAPGDLYDPAYWRTVDETWGKHPGVAYLDETSKYLMYQRGLNRRRQHKQHKAGLSSWLRTAERLHEREAQKRQQWQRR